MPKIWRFFDKAELFECYQCARCTGSCPAVMVTDKAIGPREMLLRCLDLGHRAVVEDEGLWYCATCHSDTWNDVHTAAGNVNHSTLVTVTTNNTCENCHDAVAGGNAPDAISSPFGIDGLFGIDHDIINHLD